MCAPINSKGFLDSLTYIYYIIIIIIINYYYNKIYNVYLYNVWCTSPKISGVIYAIQLLKKLLFAIMQNESVLCIII